MTHPQLTFRDNRAITVWLVLCVVLVASMVLIGGYTRLSGSGLSITSWKPIHGVLPPLNDMQWDEEFAAYQQSPQFTKINSTMSLLEFKDIFWPEFIHRLLGRLVGVFFLLPFIAFAVRGSLKTRLGFRMAGIFALGGLQGVIGWLMVKSGLINDPNVSHLRLALHLSMAFTIFALILWTIMDVVSANRPPAKIRNKIALPAFSLWFALLCVQIVFGAFMAGLHAGLIYNTWPTMNGQWVPDDLFFASPWYDNLTLVQFIHRKIPILLTISFLFWWYHQREFIKSNHLGRACMLVIIALAIQFILGVLTLINAVPLPLALIHQMTALLLFSTGIVLLHKLKHCHGH